MLDATAFFSYELPTGAFRPGDTVTARKTASAPVSRARVPPAGTHGIAADGGAPSPAADAAAASAVPPAGPGAAAAVASLHASLVASAAEHPRLRSELFALQADLRRELQEQERLRQYLHELSAPPPPPGRGEEAGGGTGGRSPLLSHFGGGGRG